MFITGHVLYNLYIVIYFYERYGLDYFPAS